MKTNIKLIELEGIETPEFAEPNGEAFRQAMSEIYLKVEEKRQIRNGSLAKIKNLRAKLNKIKNDLIMADDEFEKLEIRRKRKELEEEINNIDDYSLLDVDAYAKKLVNDSHIQNLRNEALQEFQENAAITKDYEKALKQRYKDAIHEVNRFMADYNSDSEFNQANSRYNKFN